MNIAYSISIFSRVLTRVLGSTRTTYAAIFLTVFFVASYVYLLNETIVEVVARKRAESDVSALSARVSELEFRYITLNSDLDIEYARSLGFREVEQPLFANRDATTVLSMDR